MRQGNIISFLVGIALIVGGIMLMGEFILTFLRFAIGLLLFLIGAALVLGGYATARIRRF